MLTGILKATTNSLQNETDAAATNIPPTPERAFALKGRIKLKLSSWRKDMNLALANFFIH